MKVLVLGGDGYIGWPTALKLKAAGHQVQIGDNFYRRNIKQPGETVVVTGAGIGVRARISDILFTVCDVSSEDSMDNLIRSSMPDCIVYLAENKVVTSADAAKALTNLTNVINKITTFCPKTHLIYLNDYRVLEAVPYVQDPFKPGVTLESLKCLWVNQMLKHFSSTGTKITELLCGAVHGAQTDLTQQSVDFQNREIECDLVDDTDCHSYLTLLVMSIQAAVDDEPKAGEGLRWVYV